MKMLGHRNIQNTLVYTQLANYENDEYCSAVAKTAEETRKPVESGFIFVCDMDGIRLFSKRKCQNLGKNHAYLLRSCPICFNKRISTLLYSPKRKIPQC
jgi:hypothetical protein